VLQSYYRKGKQQKEDPNSWPPRTNTEATKIKEPQYYPSTS